MKENIQFDLDTELIRFCDSRGSSSFTIRHAVEGVQIFGSNGSGKTSASARLIALRYLLAGFGGLVLTAKAEEKDAWLEYCHSTGRLKDLVIIEPGGNHFFNFLEYESTNKSGGTSLTVNLVNVLKTVISSMEARANGKNDDAFWDTAVTMLIHNTIELCQLSYGQVSIQSMYDIVTTAPKTDVKRDSKPKTGSFEHVFGRAQGFVNAKVDEFISGLTEEDKRKYDDPDELERVILENIPEANQLRMIDQFFIETYRTISEKTRSIIEFCFSGFLFNLMNEPIYSLFCKYRSTVTPEDCLNGKIILINLPVKQYDQVGTSAQLLVKYIWQRAMERRSIKLNDRPQFLFADESQNFLHEHDASYQATARSSRIATVYISQNLPNYYANMAGNKSEFLVKSFLGTLVTKIFHCNADIDTNNYASSLIGQAYTEDNSSSTTVSGNFSSSKSRSFKLENMVRSEEFGCQKNGGLDNNFLVEAYVHRQGKPFHNGFNFMKVTFSQTPNINL